MTAKLLVWPRRIRERAMRSNGGTILLALENVKTQGVAVKCVLGDGLVLAALAPILVEAVGSALSDEQKKLAGEAVAFLVEEHLGIGLRTIKRVLRTANVAGFVSCMRYVPVDFEEQGTSVDEPIESVVTVDEAIKVLVAALPTGLLTILDSAIEGELQTR